MYTKDKGQRITLRLSDDQYKRLIVLSEKYGYTPSDLLRRMIDIMYIGRLEHVEDVKTDRNDKL